MICNLRSRLSGGRYWSYVQKRGGKPCFLAKHFKYDVAISTRYDVAMTTKYDVSIYAKYDVSIQTKYDVPICLIFTFFLIFFKGIY